MNSITNLNNFIRKFLDQLFDTFDEEENIGIDLHEKFISEIEKGLLKKH